MKFLEKYDFKKEDIDEFINNTPKKLMEVIKENKELIEANLAYLKSLEIKTYREIFIDYPDMFFMDVNNFKQMFERYERESLVEKLNKNYKMVEFL
ncbi:MAG: hypothetical protein E7172_06345 [Firmicutes bacterium]|nr:hypothetical protein [Bacillota bacterium]